MLFRFALVILAISASPAFASCDELATGTHRIPVLSPPLGVVVTGTGRVQFHSAPRHDCVMIGVFVLPKDHLVAYAESDDGWTSVMYSGDGGGGVTGWVTSSRLKSIGPR